MAKRYDVDTLISQVRLSENLPDGAQVFSDDDILVFMNEELQITVNPLILQCREDYFTVTKDFTFPAGESSGNTIEIPTEAMGYKLRDVYVCDSIGNFINLPRFTPTQAASFGANFNLSNYGNYGAWQTIAGFYIQGNTLEIYPYTAAQNNSFRLLYHKRPAELVTLSECGKIIAINVVNGLLSLDNIPSTWTADTLIDLVDDNPPFNYIKDQFAANKRYATPATLTEQAFASTPSGNQVFVDPILADQLTVGQYVCETGTAPFVQFLPPDVYPLLKEATAIRCLRALNDTEAEQMAIQKFKAMSGNVVSGLTIPRVEGKPKKLISNNSIGRYSRTYGGRFY